MLSNKKALIVGATGGIGQETTRLLHKSGVEVFLTGRDPGALQLLVEELGVSADHSFIMDVTDAEQVRKIAERLHKQVEAFDILINAAGIGIIKSMDSLEPEDFSKVIDVNLKGAFHVLKFFLPPMKERKEGLIVNLPGVLGKTPMAGAAAYAASKYGLNGMMKSIREELRRTEIRITNLYLGGTDTPFWDEIDMRVNRDKFVSAKEAGKAVWFLCQQPDSGVVSEMVLQPFNHQAI